MRLRASKVGKPLTVQKAVNRVLLGLMLVMGCALPASALSLEELTPYFSAQYFTWEEYSEGRRLLKESGPLFSAGVLAGFTTRSSWTLRGKGEFFGGQVGYDGETQGPTVIPVQTDVTYLGTRQELDLGYRVHSGALRIESFGGVGARWWLRALQDTSTAGQPVSGYSEWWRTAYGRLGARARYFQPSGLTCFAEGGAKYPFYNANSISFASSGVSTFHPGGKWSGFAESGVSWRRLKATLYYEGFRFSRSSNVSVGNEQFFQPESSADIFGLSLGWAFR